MKMCIMSSIIQILYTAYFFLSKSFTVNELDVVMQFPLEYVESLLYIHVYERYMFPVQLLLWRYCTS